MNKIKILITSTSGVDYYEAKEDFNFIHNMFSPFKY
jgi:hypothetical protein